MHHSTFKNVILLTSFIAALYAAGISTWREVKQDKIAYVNSNTLLLEYAGAKEAREKVEARTTEWNKNIQTLEDELKAMNDAYKAERQELKAEQLAEKEDALRSKHQEYMKYKHSVQQKAEELEVELTQPVLEELNRYIAEYGTEKGYRVILGTLSGGNILYGQDAADITTDVLNYANSRS